MTEEEYFRKTYPDYCYGNRLLSPYWDLFQDGVEFGERLSEKKIEELEKENAELKADNDARKYAMAMSEKVEEQLREQIKQIEKISDYNADQLAQAKEIIKDLMSFPVQLCDCRHTVDFEKTREKAVQFLKEIEK